MPETLFDQLGGEARLREIIDSFIDRVFDDPMIGFFFRKADRKRLKEMEYQFTARFLGADVTYAGRPMDQAHARHPIMGGQFARRQKILRDTLKAYNVPAEIQEAWMQHTESLRSLITGDAGSECDPQRARERVDDMSKRS
ncbi:MAG: group 1 truncated hemoglobin [Deltaproteobacteria bacterium]|nr:group 1 truncated hemoglobin [Deltaproteobacteria bacterium]